MIDRAGITRALAATLVLAATCVGAPAVAFAWGGGGGGHGWGGGGGHGWGGHGWGGWGWHGWGLHGWGWRGFGWRGYGYYGQYQRPVLSGYPYQTPYYYGNSGYAPGCVWVRQLVDTPYGPQWRVTPACAYGY